MRVLDETDSVEIDDSQVRRVRFDLCDVDYFVYFLFVVTEFKGSYAQPDDSAISRGPSEHGSKLFWLHLKSKLMNRQRWSSEIRRK